ncbi:Rha family transcriptional regulator [Pseudomonas sp. Irchel 3A18]|uniref:Rha family transcriptional regulator n=1 Tax=Pseudomonas sp. Irchel 3A18 TaxID=2008905 RepID=UPI002114E88A|nr:Rha family transcriptional regulator [Pseudomonas sp. Irchel 3A18]
MPSSHYSVNPLPPRHEIAPSQNVARNVSMTSLELVDFINQDRKRQALSAGMAFPCDGYPKLMHKNLLSKVPEVLGETSAKFSANLPDRYGRPRRGYSFPKREACLIAMSYSYDLQAKVFDRMSALEESEKAKLTPGSPKIVGELAIMECFTRLLKPAPSCQMQMLAKIAENNGLDPKFLPAYAVDAAPDAGDGGGSMPTKALTALIKEFGIASTAAAFNRLLEKHGFLKVMQRKNSRQEMVDFWSVTEKGLRYGKNLTSPQSPRETQPHWYVDRFLELAKLVGKA